MSSDFVLLPPTKSGNSVRLKTKNIRDPHSETLQLEMQNQEMEQKLNQLRLSMSKEKAERERFNGYHWKSGQSLNNTQICDKENVGKVSSGKVKLKVLKNSVTEPEKPKTFSRPPDMHLPTKPKTGEKLCGQCESKRALLMCLECGEDYCAACFANFHQKGALKLHRTMPFQRKSQDGKLDVSHTFRKELNVDESSRNLVKDKDFIRQTVSSEVKSVAVKEVSREATNSSRKQYVPETAGSLLHGSFDENDSAKYFNEALLEWRNQTHCEAQHLSTADMGTDCAGNSAAQNVLTVLGKSLEVEFKESGLNYMEKLMLKKHRRTPINQFASIQIDQQKQSPIIPPCELDECNLTAEEMDAHEHYAALFRTEEHVRNDVTHEPSLKIVEIDKEPEEGLEETRHFLVTIKTSEMRNPSESFSEAEHQKLVSPRLSIKLPLNSGETQENMPLRSTYSMCKGEPLNISQDKIVLKASHLEDSKSMKYESFKDSPSLDLASMVNVPQDFQNIVLRENNRTSKYQGLKGFFTLETDYQKAGIDLQHTTELTSDKYDADKEITCTGGDYWRPESSLGGFADETIVQEIIEKAQTHYDSTNKGHCATSGNGNQRKLRTLTGRPFSANSQYRTPRPLETSRPSTSRGRPMSRAASEISEIESVDIIDGHDHLFEVENEREALSVLEKELYALKLGEMSNPLYLSSHEHFQLSKHGKTFTQGEVKNSLKRSQMHIAESYNGETESEDEETLQDKLNILSLQ